jgi:tRNA(Ile)-lysidine synthase TilS/MesJ
LQLLLRVQVGGKSLVKKGADAERELQAIIEQIKLDGKGNKYDCVLALSGGVDSTYLAYYASKVD